MLFSFTDFPPLPALLTYKAEEAFNQLNQYHPVLNREAAIAALSMSSFVTDALFKHPQWWQALDENPPQADEWQNYRADFAVLIKNCIEENQLLQILRQYRQHMLVRISWMQSLQWCSTEETLRQLSELAETLIIAARDWLWNKLRHDLGTPVNRQGKPQPLFILAMGKLGGGELNFSSDIDLIFVYPEHGNTQGGRREIDNGQFFTRLGQKLIRALDLVTVDGFVYRVDMRLRPFGDSGPLVMSFSAFEDYYQEQGRDWERYAMVKAKVLNGQGLNDQGLNDQVLGDRNLGDSEQTYFAEIEKMLRPFVFRRYIDFSVLQSLRNMKNMIAREVRRRGLKNNIKLGAGGIREIEFIAQVFQLIRGGREPDLQDRQLLTTLDVIGQLDLLPLGQVSLLKDNYLHLRRMENILQAIADKQSQTLPDDPTDQQRLVWAMHFPDWTALQNDLNQRMASVRQIFNELVGEEESDDEESTANLRYKTLWLDQLEPDEFDQLMPQLQQEQCLQVGQFIGQFRQDVNKRPIGRRGSEVLDQLMPNILEVICQKEDAVAIMPRLFHILLSIITRTTYLELLLEYPSALTQLVHLCSASPMIASQLARYPILLDELLEPGTLYQPLPLHAYRDELRQYLLRVSDDEEQHIEALRQFKQAQLLRIAAADISGTLPVMKVSDHLTYLAEATIDVVIQHAWQQMTQRFGEPTHIANREEKGFAVIAYGKLGGIELAYGSDLDLVFLIDCPVDIVTDGARNISGIQFYMRLTQRIIHLLNTRTASGVLYEVDARLRPSGESGLLVSTIDAFYDYQRNEAWTWEHQALVRARIIYGDTSLKRKFNEIRHEILCRIRDAEPLKKDVNEMRSKMREHHNQLKNEWFDLKTDKGGITDIEFITQFLVLNYANQQPDLTRWTDNVRLLKLMVQTNLIDEQESQALINAYVTLRDANHHLTLQELAGKVAQERFTEERVQVEKSWQYWLGGNRA